MLIISAMDYSNPAAGTTTKLLGYPARFLPAVEYGLEVFRPAQSLLPAARLWRGVRRGCEGSPSSFGHMSDQPLHTFQTGRATEPVRCSRERIIICFDVIHPRSAVLDHFRGGAPQGWIFV